MMILVLDLVGTNLESGTKSFNINLLKQFLKNEIKAKIFIFTTRDYLKDIQIDKIPKNIKLIIKPNYLGINLLKIVWMQIIFPFELKFLGIKKVYSSMNYCPLVCKLFKIEIFLNIHSNLHWVHFNQMPGSKIKNFLIKFLMFLSIKLSDKLIVNSYFAKKEIKQKLKLNSKKIFVNYLGVYDDKIKEKENKSLKFNFKNKYILSVSSCVRYHDFLQILKAFKKTKYKIKNIKLVFIMQILDKKYFNEINSYVDQNFHNNEIYFFENLNPSLLKKFYKNSLFYIFSSYCEVFGLTSLEAMKNKTPVLISKCSALPEINGKAAMYFNPNNHIDISKKMKKLIKSNGLRKSLIKKGIKQAEKFNWFSTYKSLIKILI